MLYLQRHTTFIIISDGKSWSGFWWLDTKPETNQVIHLQSTVNWTSQVELALDRTLELALCMCQPTSVCSSAHEVNSVSQ